MRIVEEEKTQTTTVRIPKQKNRDYPPPPSFSLPKGKKNIISKRGGMEGEIEMTDLPYFGVPQQQKMTLNGSRPSK